MNYEIPHEFDHSIDLIEKAMLDPKLIPHLVKEMVSIDEMEILEITDNGSTISRKVRYLPKPIIKRIGLKKIPPKAMEWIEVSTYDKKSKTLSYDNQSTHPKVRKIFINNGKISLTKIGEKTKRVVAGELRVDVKILGRIAEKIIFKTAKKVLKEEAEAMRSFIKNNYV
jgi:Protein of unknown function (DUF2505)